MNEVKYLNSTTSENMNAIKDYIDRGYLTWLMLEANSEDRMETISEVYKDLIINDPIKIFGDYENAYLAALRVLGEKSDSLFGQLMDIRSGEIWKKL